MIIFVIQEDVTSGDCPEGYLIDTSLISSPTNIKHLMETDENVELEMGSDREEDILNVLQTSQVPYPQLVEKMFYVFTGC